MIEKKSLQIDEKENEISDGNNNNNNNNNNKKELKNDNEVRVTLQCFELALQEIKPAFGVDTQTLNQCCRGTLYDYGNYYRDIRDWISYIISSVQLMNQNGDQNIDQNENHNSSGIMKESVLLSGPSGCGKKSLICSLALECKFEYTKIIHPSLFQGKSELNRVNMIIQIFEDAYKSPCSLIILDGIETLIDYISVGPRFSVSVLQTLITSIKQPHPYADHRLMIVGTCSNESEILLNLKIQEAFQLSHTLEHLNSRSQIVSVFKNLTELINFEFNSDSIYKSLDELCARFELPISIKALSSLIDGLSNINGPVKPANFIELLRKRKIIKKTL